MRATIFLIFTFCSIAGFDYWLIAKYGKYESISAVLIRSSYDYPMIPFLFGMIIGFVCGHLFWRMKSKDIWQDKKDRR